MKAASHDIAKALLKKHTLIKPVILVTSCIMTQNQNRLCHLLKPASLKLLALNLIGNQVAFKKATNQSVGSDLGSSDVSEEMVETFVKIRVAKEFRLEALYLPHVGLAHRLVFGVEHNVG